MCNKLPEGSTFIFGDGQISLQHSVGQVKGSRYTKKTAGLIAPFKQNSDSDGPWLVPHHHMVKLNYAMQVC